MIYTYNLEIFMMIHYFAAKPIHLIKINIIFIKS